MIKPYAISGIVLAILGAGLALFFYNFFRSIPLIGLCLSAVIIGLTSISLSFMKNFISSGNEKIYQTRNIRALVVLCGVIIVIDILLALSAQTDLAIYFLLNAISFFTFVLYLGTTQRIPISLGIESFAIFLGFLFVLTLKIIPIFTT